MSWRDDALCATEDNAPYREAFFSEEPADIARAKRLCARCPVALWCELAGLREAELVDMSADRRAVDIGIYGGLTGRELYERVHAGDENQPEIAPIALRRDKGIGMLILGVTPLNVARLVKASSTTVYEWQHAIQEPDRVA